MIQMFFGLLAQIPEILFGNADNAVAAYSGYAIGTVMLFMPVYLPIVLIKLFTQVKSKMLDKVLAWTIALNAVLATGPCSIPLGIVGMMIWSAWQISGRTNRGNRRNRRQNRSRDDDDD